MCEGPPAGAAAYCDIVKLLLDAKGLGQMCKEVSVPSLDGAMTKLPENRHGVPANPRLGRNLIKGDDEACGEL